MPTMGYQWALWRQGIFQGNNPMVKVKHIFLSTILYLGISVRL